MRHLPIVLAFLSLLSVSAIARAQAPAAPAPAPPPLPPLLANLTMPLDASRAKVGTKVQANVVSVWTGNGCNLRVGALVEGHVSGVERRSKAAPRSAIHLVFDSAECNKKRGTPLKATLIALLGPPDAPAGMGKGLPLTDTPNEIGRSVEGAAAANQNFIVEHSIPTSWKPGMVVDVPMNLTIGTGAEGGSIVWTMNTDARLEQKTTLILVVKPEAPQPSTVTSPHP